MQFPSVKPKSETKHPAVDLRCFKKEEAQVEFDGNHPFACGTLLPKTDADIWLAAAFSDFEKVVS